MNGRLHFIRFVYWFGAIGDAISTLAMLFPAQLLMVDRSFLSPATRGAFAAGAALMLGWTILLAWGSFEPIARRGILLMTAIPVVPGLAASIVYGYRSGCMPLPSAAVMWCFQTVFFSTMLIAFWMAGQEVVP